MDAAQITQNLNTLFNASGQGGLPGARRLVFWYDPNAEFREVFDELQLDDGIEKLLLANTPFTVKYRLLIEAPKTSFLLYAPFAEPQENPLLDLQKQAELFSADRAAMLFRSFNLHDRSLQEYLRAHLPFFNSKRRLTALNEMGVAPQSSEMDLRLAMMCALAGLRAADGNLFLRSLLMASLSESENELWTELTRFFTAEEVWALARHTLSFTADAPSLRELFVRLSLTHLQHDLKASLPDALTAKLIAPPTKAYVFLDGWIRHSDHAPRWAELSERVAGDLGIPELAQSLAPAAYAKVETFRDFDRALIQHVTAALQTDAAPFGKLRDLLSGRKALYWYDPYADYYEALEAATDFFEALARFDPKGKVAELFAAYADETFELDQHYRHYLSAADRTESDVLKTLTERLERAYTYGFLEPLAAAWSAALKAQGNVWGQEVTADKQWRFYDRYVEPILLRNDREKVFVIISDALRFEVADELKRALMTDLRGDALLTPLLGILPSITPLGKAALLPGKKLELTPQGEVLVDGKRSGSSVERQAILNAGGISSLVIDAAKLLSLSRDDGREVVQPHRVIYLFHDRIDATGEKLPNERHVFAACREAVTELHALVRKIANTLNGTNILVTSDHGFLYQRQALETHDKVERLKAPAADLLSAGRRHVLAHNLPESEGSLTFNLPYLKPEGLKAQVPWGTLRYALQGAGAQYVHGGASLQEVCVPLLTYKHVRASKGDEGASRKVGVRINALVRKITNNTFTVRLIQEEPISERVRPRGVTVKFVDPAGKSVTNEAPLNLSSDAAAATDREYIARFSIGIPNPERDKPYYLVVTDSEDDLEILRETWSISLAFTDDFGAF